MKFAFLPNYFKKIGLICFFAAFAVIIISTIVNMIDVVNSIENFDGGYMAGYRLGQALGQDIVETQYWIPLVSSILLLLSIAFYMLAKEKVDDEYMDAIRWESLRLSVIISIGIAILFASLHWGLPAKSLLFIQFVSYLITFKIKKSQTIENEE